MGTGGRRRDQLGSAAAWTLAAILPLASSVIPTDDVMPLRLIALSVGVALGLMATARGRLPKSAAILLLVFLAVFTVAGLQGDTPMLSLIGRFPRYEGLPVVAMFAAALWIGARSFGPKSMTNRDTAYSAIAVSAMAMASVVVMQAMMYPGERASGLLNSAMVTGTWGLISVGMLGWKVWSEPRLLWIIGAVSGLVVIALAGSRGALLGLTPAVLLTALWRPFLKPRGRIWWIAPALAVLVAVGGGGRVSEVPGAADPAPALHRQGPAGHVGGHVATGAVEPHPRRRPRPVR